jgi:hypothetical protein
MELMLNSKGLGKEKGSKKLKTTKYKRIKVQFLSTFLPLFLVNIVVSVTVILTQSDL